MPESIQKSRVFPVARAKVRELLTKSEAFRGLPDAERRALAHAMVKVATFIAGGANGNTVPAGVALVDPKSGAATLADKAPAARQQAEQRAGRPTDRRQAGRRRRTAGQDLETAAAEQGVGALGQAIQSVAFPEFVAGLIDGVFNAIVSASIKQMEAYSELVKNVAKSVDQFMKDNVSENQARDYLVDRYPDHLQLNLEEEQPRVEPREDADEDTLPDFFADLGLSSPIDDIDEDTVEQVLVPAARRRMAMDRQQLLATMVLMGINRIVVTDGKISASVVFQLDTTDLVERSLEVTAEAFERKWRRKRPGFLGWFKPSVAREKSYSQFKVTTHQEEDSEAAAELKVKLKGNVDVNFRSETFPLERMTDILIVENIRSKAPGQGATPATSETQAPRSPTASPPATGAPPAA
jgi:hypothetical protein